MSESVGGIISTGSDPSALGTVIGMLSESIIHLSIPVDDLASAREFYETAFGCRIGRVRDDWIDVWFFGLQLSLQLRPDEVTAPDKQGVRHFGVVLEDRAAFEILETRLRAAHVDWLSEPSTHAQAVLSGKTSGKLADPSGNVIEIKYYDDPSEFLG
jgi:extradiol dioxygenase family protein